jgi:hypothetical protein
LGFAGWLRVYAWRDYRNIPLTSPLTNGAPFDLPAPPFRMSLVGLLVEQHGQSRLCPVSLPAACVPLSLPAACLSPVCCLSSED